MFHVVDDDEDLCELAAEILESSGYQVLSFSNPVGYLDYVYSDNYVDPVAIFTDVQMPEMNGYELIDRVREKLPEQKFVVVSGYDDGSKALRGKACQFLPKPFSPEKLIAIADAIVRCDKEGASVANTMCKVSIDESDLDMWSCPLDCPECEQKRR